MRGGAAYLTGGARRGAGAGKMQDDQATAASFLSLDWRGANDGSHVSLVDAPHCGQFELVFCGTGCLRDHLNEKLDELEGRRGPGWPTVDGRSPIEWDELDPGIRDVVKYLRDLGFDTFTSCEGGEGHLHDRPTVTLLAHDETLESLRRRVVSALLRGGYRNFISTISFSHGPSDRHPFGSWLQVDIEFWLDRIPVRPYAAQQDQHVDEFAELDLRGLRS